NSLEKLPSIGICSLTNKRRLNSMSPQYKVLGFRFRPEFLQLFFNERISEIKSSFIDLHELLYESAEDLLQKLLNADDEIKIIEVMNNFLKKNLSAEKPDRRVAYALDKIRNGEVQNIEELSRQVQLSSTSLRTLFKKNIGVSPKEF